jgi:hypothetical protein
MVDAADVLPDGANEPFINTDVVIRRIPQVVRDSARISEATSWCDIAHGCRGRCACPDSSECGYCIAFRDAGLGDEAKARQLYRKCQLVRHEKDDATFRLLNPVCCNCLQGLYRYIRDKNEPRLTRILYLEFRLQHYQ